MLLSRPDASLANLVMLAWPLVCVLLFTWNSKYRAALYCYLLGTLFLPADIVIRLPGLPPLDQNTLPGYGILIAVLVLSKKLWSKARADAVSLAAIVLMLLADVPRVFANTDPIIYVYKYVQPLVQHAAVAFILEDCLVFVLPFFLGIALGNSVERVKDMLDVWLKLALVYTPLAALEVRVSPQIHIWTYGYFQHDFIQMLRESGFRPIVFMTHGLEVALYMAISLLLAILAKTSGTRIWKVPPTVLVLLLFVMVILCKSLAAMLYGGLGAILLLWASPRTRTFVAKLLALVILTYPLLRLMSWVPTEAIVEFIRDTINPDRAGSLQYRFQNEDMTLERTLRRPLTGWGGFERIQTHDPWGWQLTVIDGSWIIELASGGIPRFLAVFGLLTWPLFKAAKVVRRLPTGEHSQLLSGMALITAFVVLDLIPNSFFNYFAPLLSGVVLGLCQFPREDQPIPDAPGVTVSLDVRR